MHTLDTNAIIYYLKNDPEAAPLLEKILGQDYPVYIFSITEVGLFGFIGLRAKEESQINNLLKTLSIIPLDSQLAKIAGFIRRSYRLKTPDSIIAATAMFTASTLVTRNIRDFKKIPDLSLKKI